MNKDEQMFFLGNMLLCAKVDVFAESPALKIHVIPIISYFIFYYKI